MTVLGIQKIFALFLYLASKFFKNIIWPTGFRDTGRWTQTTWPRTFDSEYLSFYAT